MPRTQLKPIQGEQLSFLEYKPTPEELEPPKPNKPPAVYEIGDRIRGKTLSGRVVEGKFLALSMSGMIKVESAEPILVEGIRRKSSLYGENHLALLIPETVERISEQPSINPHALAWHQAQAAYYLTIMNLIMKSDRLPSIVKRAETSRLHQLREQALNAVKTLENQRN